MGRKVGRKASKHMKMFQRGLFGFYKISKHTRKNMTEYFRMLSRTCLAERWKAMKDMVLFGNSCILERDDGSIKHIEFPIITPPEIKYEDFKYEKRIQSYKPNQRFRGYNKH